MQSYFAICSNCLFWLKEISAHKSLGKCWEMAAKAEAMSRQELDSLAKSKLKAILLHAASTVPFYRRYFKENGIALKSLRIEDFPILGKSDIRGHEDEFVADGFSSRLHWARTSGSTGEPFRFARTEYDHSYAALWRGLLRFGIHPGDKRVLVKGVDESPSVSLKTRISRWAYGKLNRCIVVDAHFLAKSDANIAAELKRIVAYKPRYFHGYVSSIYLLAQYSEQHGIDLAALNVKAIVTESEKCHNFQRELMERVFRAPVVENYGCVEFGMIAQPAKDGKPCINEDHVYVEATSEGEVVLTNLDEFGFPLIRFKNGDLIKLGGVHPQLPYLTVDSLDGRVAETIYLPQGGSLQGYIVMYPISKRIKYLKQYQVYQPDIGHLIIRLVCSDAGLPEVIREQMTREMREIIGDGMEISFESVDAIPLTKRGKRAFVVSDVMDRSSWE